MPHAIVVFFDEEESAPINEIIKELAIQNVSTFMFEKSIPHITLAIYDELKGESSKEKLKEFALKTKPAPFRPLCMAGGRDRGRAQPRGRCRLERARPSV